MPLKSEGMIGRGEGEQTLPIVSLVIDDSAYGPRIFIGY